MASQLPRVVHKTGGRGPVIWVLAGAIVLLGVVLGVLILGGPLFSGQPRSGLDRDYEVLLNASRTDPDNPAVLMTLAEAQYDLGRERESLQSAAEAARIATSTAGIPLRYAQLLLLAKDLRGAEKWARKEMSLESSAQPNAEARFVLGQVLFDEKKTNEALKVMSEGLALDPNAADVRVKYAEMLAASGKKKQAIDEFELALRFLPSDERAIRGLKGLGVSYEESATANPHAGSGTGK